MRESLPHISADICQMDDPSAQRSLDDRLNGNLGEAWTGHFRFRCTRWAGLYQVGDRPSHHFAWVQRGDEIRSVTSVRRDVLEYHPTIHLATRQEITAQDESGDTYRFRGEAIASAVLPAWPNVSFHDSVYRWEDDHGRVTHCTYQEIWFDTYQRAMLAHRLQPTTA